MRQAKFAMFAEICKSLTGSARWRMTEMMMMKITARE